MDHVIAETFFIAGDGDKLPAEMITVPSCHACDSGRGDGGPRDFHLDEDYVKIVIVTRLGMDGHPVARKLVPKAVRAYENSPKLAAAVLGRSEERVLLSEVRGILHPVVARTMNVEIERVWRVIRKIVRGLHFKNRGIPLTHRATIDVWEDLSQERLHELMALMHCPWYGWESGVFLYKFMGIAGHPESSVWLMVFYERYAILAVANGPVTPRVMLPHL